MTSVPQDDSDTDAYREISGKTYVLTLLQRLVQQRQLVTLTVPGSARCFTSTVLTVEPHEGYLLLDQVFPQQGQSLLLQAGHAEIRADSAGASLKFSASLLAHEEANGLVFYRLSYPRSVSYLQRRDAHRVLVEELAIPVKLLDHQGKVHKGCLHDISPSGIAVQLEQGSTFEMQEIYRFGIFVSGMEPLRAEMEVCCNRHVGKGGESIIGGTFVLPERRIEHSLNRLMAELERRLLRARRNPQTPLIEKEAAK